VKKFVLMHNTLIFYVQVPVAYISSLILTFFKTFCRSGFFIILWDFFKVNSGVFSVTEWQHWSQSASRR